MIALWQFVTKRGVHMHVDRGFFFFFFQARLYLGAGA